jgi:hypothetical protein
MSVWSLTVLLYNLSFSLPTLRPQVKATAETLLVSPGVRSLYYSSSTSPADHSICAGHGHGA